MTRSFLGQQDNVTVAIAFDDESPALVQAGQRIAKQLGKSLRLVHVCEPWIDYSMSHPLGDVMPLATMTRAIEDDIHKGADLKLRELAKDVDDVQVDTKVVSGGRPSDGLAADAITSRCAMVIVGMGLAGKKFIPKGLSTGVQLMAHAPVPVMVMDTETARSFTGPLKRVFVADDLSDQATPVVDFAFELAAAVGDCQLHHAHVNGLTLENLRAGLDTAAAASHTSVNEDLNADEIFGDVIKRLEKKMSDRASRHEDYLVNAGGEYFTELETGEVSEELDRMISAIDPSVLVYGRHRMLHKAPFLIGRVPFRAMLEQKRPVIVVPNES